PWYPGDPAGGAVAAVAEERLVFEGAARVEADLADAQVGELPPEPGTQIQPWRALARLAGAPGHVLFDVCGHVRGHLVAVATDRRAEQRFDPVGCGARLVHRLERSGHDAHARADTSRVHRGDYTGFG